MEGLIALKLRSYDFLILKLNHDDKTQSKVKPIASFYKQLFTLWHTDYVHRGINIRICEDIVRLLLGRNPVAQTIKANCMRHVAIATDGTLEPLDNLRINGNDHVNTRLNILSSDLDSVVSNKVWGRIRDESAQLPDECHNCEFMHCCRGGYMAMRYSSKKGYNNRSIYCEDYKQIFTHAWETIREDLSIKVKKLGIAKKR